MLYLSDSVEGEQLFIVALVCNSVEGKSSFMAASVFVFKICKEESISNLICQRGFVFYG